MRIRPPPVGSSDNVPGFVDSVQTVTYESGNIIGYTQPANAAAPGSPVGSTSFDMLFADNSTVQTSYDYPYYGFSSPDPAACTQPLCAAMSLNTTARLTNGNTTCGNITGSSSTPAPSQRWVDGSQAAVPRGSMEEIATSMLSARATEASFGSRYFRPRRVRTCS